MMLCALWCTLAAAALATFLTAALAAATLAAATEPVCVMLVRFTR
jgi:hypothetical protein